MVIKILINFVSCLYSLTLLDFEVNVYHDYSAFLGFSLKGRLLIFEDTTLEIQLSFNGYAIRRSLMDFLSS